MATALGGARDGFGGGSAGEGAAMLTRTLSEKDQTTTGTASENAAVPRTSPGSASAATGQSGPMSTRMTQSEDATRRIRARYAERLHLKKVEMYFKALEIVRAREMITHKTVTFKIHKPTHFGQEVRIVGDIPELGAWNPNHSIPMKWTEGNIWVAKVDIPLKNEALHVTRSAFSTALSDGVVAAYKFIIRPSDSPSMLKPPTVSGQDSLTIWEEGKNHTLSFAPIQRLGDQFATVEDSWGSGASYCV